MHQALRPWAAKNYVAERWCQEDCRKVGHPELRRRGGTDGNRPGDERWSLQARRTGVPHVLFSPPVKRRGVIYAERASGPLRLRSPSWLSSLALVLPGSSAGSRRADQAAPVEAPIAPKELTLKRVVVRCSNPAAKPSPFATLPLLISKAASRSSPKSQPPLRALAALGCRRSVQSERTRRLHRRLVPV
jgi:hypothetical protein